MSLEQVLLITVLILAPLLNFLVRRLRRYAEGRAHRSLEPEPAGMTPPARPAPPAPMETRGEPRSPLLVAQPSAPVPPAGRRRPRVGAMTRRDARRGFVLMTVLGPCRGEALGPRASRGVMPGRAGTTRA